MWHFLPRSLPGLAARAALALLAAAVPASAAAQGPPPEVWQQLRERELTQQELALEQRQYQEAARPGLTASDRAMLERLHVRERRDFQLHRQQESRQIAETARRTRQLPEADAQIRQRLHERQADEQRAEAQHGVGADSRRFLQGLDPRHVTRHDTRDTD